jgi:2-desacetyl-2-hydroxyethyl bacteriochlorophyllide A dehydrogenase
MTAMMKAAVLRQPGEMAIESLPVPEPDAGWVRVKTMASGICGSDLHLYTGNHPWLAPGSPMRASMLGAVYGHEVAGVVDAIGADVTKLAPGDHVALVGIVPCGKCAYCRVGQYQICTDLHHFGLHYSGGFAEYLLIPEDYAYPIPASLSFEEGALLDVLVVGIHAVQRGAVSLADRVAVLGGGPIGLAVAAAAKRAGARDIFLTVRHPLQRQMAERIGVGHILDDDELATGRVLEVTGGLGVDCVIEAVGYKASTIATAIAMARRGGRIVFTGVFEEPVPVSFGDILVKELTITASHAFGLWNLTPEFELAVEMLARGEFPAADLVTHRFALEDINQAFHTKLERSAEALKVQIVF